MDIVIRAAVAYLFILFLMRVVGRRELSSMEPSDVILPPPDVSLEEAKAEFSGEGLIPG